ncbi:uncharacterized protein HMPREF1541_08623 [Cyphellophora europaea CBS 101466]|uniref:ceramidase n=1 Tax=Cyphellophora europaea (strain CBS 101466) TaxID=1220924 RepID=W2RIQ0_CYPE1|nr:uncharacterized protein HMPREF1541_08623 [Cyphellophora europaea CBS 101466]ETN36346.1 hypothetical protein HMPREF1541_08623 [Cyphellophora europaea CBS 101466]
MAPRSHVPPTNVPVHRIDLSLPPRERYKELARQYIPQIASITPLFNQLLADLGIPEKRHGTVNTLARLMLRGVYSPVETAELRGICEVTGVDMYLLVALNVVLDLLMGCTSSTVRSDIGKIWHLRTLDWGMDPLRDVIVQLDFIRSDSRRRERPQPDGSDRSDEVIASSITYVGFVGVLTGARPGLSMSLNFRALHNAHTRWGHIRFYAHHLAVLLGYRQSISSVLRQYLLDDDRKPVTLEPKKLAEIELDFQLIHTTAAYLVFCDGSHSVAVEKDFATANIRWDKDGFLVATNHDLEDTNTGKDPTPAGAHSGQLARMKAMEELVEDSKERSECVSAKWRTVARRASGRSTRSSRGLFGISQDDAIKWVCDWPTTNETTHFATVMDAKDGVIRWAHAYPEPALEPSACRA